MPELKAPWVEDFAGNREMAAGVPYDMDCRGSAAYDGLIDCVQLFSVPGMRENKRGLMTRMTGLFRREAAVSMSEMCAAADAGDAVALSTAAHRLKSSSGSLGAVRVHGLACDIEGAARAGRLEFDAGARDVLERILLHTGDALEALCDSSPGTAL